MWGGEVTPKRRPKYSAGLTAKIASHLPTNLATVGSELTHAEPSQEHQAIADTKKPEQVGLFCGSAGRTLEARAGVEPTYTDLQSGA